MSNNDDLRDVQLDTFYKYDGSGDASESILHSSSSSRSPTETNEKTPDDNENVLLVNEKSNLNVTEDEVEVDGRYGVLVMVASFLSCYVVGLMFIAFSILYTDLTEYFEAKKGTIGWIGSLYLATGNICGIVLGVGIQYFGCRVIAIAGSITWSCGCFLSSFADVITLYFTFGLIAGLGFNMVTISSFVIIQKHFKKYRSLAAGLSAAGISFGSITSGPLTKFLLDLYGWRGTMLIMSALTLHCCVFGSFYRVPRMIKSKVITFSENLNQEPEKINLDPKSNEILSTATTTNPAPPPPQQPKQLSQMLRKLCRDLGDFSLFKNKQLVATLISTMLFNLGASMFYQHTPSRAVTYGVPKSNASLIHTAVGIATLAGRILGAFIGNLHCTNRIFQYGFSILLGGLCLVFTAPCTTILSICIIASFSGFAAGLTMTIQTTVMADIVGVSLVHRAQAFVLVSMGVGALISVPLAGLIYDETKSYNIPFFLFGSFQMLGGLIVIVAHIVIRLRSKLCGLRDGPPKV